MPETETETETAVKRDPQFLAALWAWIYYLVSTWHPMLPEQAQRERRVILQLLMAAVVVGVPVAAEPPAAAPVGGPETWPCWPPPPAPMLENQFLGLGICQLQPGEEQLLYVRLPNWSALNAVLIDSDKVADIQVKLASLHPPGGSILMLPLRPARHDSHEFYPTPHHPIGWLPPDTFVRVIVRNEGGSLRTVAGAVRIDERPPPGAVSWSR